MSNEGNKKLTRQEIYQRIRETGGKETYILSEMKRLGFWPNNSDQPTLAESFLEKRKQLQRQLRDLGRQQQLYQDPEKALKELHKERKKAALLRREEKRKERNEARYQRAKSWYETQKKFITFAGEGVSLGLADVNSEEEKLKAQHLPILHDSQMLAQAMGITVNELRFLTYQKDVSTVNHYQRFQMMKKTGGTRLISAPMPRLKRAQYWILSNILEPMPLHSAAHGFVREKSIVTNAAAHVGKEIVINLDLKDFFPTISYPRVKGMFKGMGYSEHISTMLALLCTEADTQEVELDNQSWFVSNGERYLPQGAPTSPNITNIICRKLDARLQGMADKLACTYTRYADDITFSAKGKMDDSTLKKLLWRCRSIIKDEGFVVHPEKTCIMRKHKKQEVTGVVVNDSLSVDRQTLKRFRALLHQIDQTGPEGKYWPYSLKDNDNNKNLFCVIEGYANFVAMVNPDKGTPLQQRVASLKQKYGYQVSPARMGRLNNKLLRLKSSRGETPYDGWWQALPPAPPFKESTAEEIKANKVEQRQAEKMIGQEISEEAENLASQANQTREGTGKREEPESPWMSESTDTGAGAGLGKGMLFIAIALLVVFFLFIK